MKMKGHLLLMLFAALAMMGQGDKVDYTGFVVVRAVPTNEEQLGLLKSLKDEIFADGANRQVDFWMEPSKVNHPVDVMVGPDKSEDLKKRLDETKIPHVTIIPDVQRANEEELASADDEDFPMTRSSYSFFSTYQRLASIHSHLDELVRRAPELAQTLSIGKSTENRDLKVIKIGSGGLNKPIIWIDGGIHAREWISPATVSYIATQLIEQYELDPSVKALVDHYDWYILPVTNPDGYEFTHTGNRMWRKTRSRTNSPWGCLGADPNRNFGFHWREGGSSTNPCTDTYAGPKAFSEPETKAVADFLLSRKGLTKAFLTVHSYSQLWLTPWGWTSAYPADYAEMKKAADVAMGALTSVHGTRYTFGTSTNVLYVASGGSDDWAHGAAGIKYAYTLELRDTGNNGFLLPANQIKPTGEETWAGVKALAQYIKDK